MLEICAENNILGIENNGDLAVALAALDAETEITFDTETTGLRPYKGDRPFMGQFYGPKCGAVYIMNYLPSLGAPYVLDTKGMAMFREWLLGAIKDPAKWWIAHNAKFDWHQLGAMFNLFPAMRSDELAGQLWDTMAIMKVIHNEMHSVSLVNCIKHAGLKHQKEGDVIDEYMTEHKATCYDNGLKSGNKAYAMVPYSLMAHYGGIDVLATNELFQYQNKVIESYIDPVTGICNAGDFLDVVQTEADVTKVLLFAEMRGLPVDKGYALERQHMVSKRLIDADMAFYFATGTWFKDSPDAIGGLFEANGIKLLKGDMTKSGKQNWLTGEAALLTTQHPWASLILNIRKLSKLNSTYFDNILELAGDDGCIHTNFRQCGANTLRMSSSDPNCYSTDTEVLTPNGWVLLKDVCVGDTVAAFSIEGECLCWENVTNTIYIKDQNVMSIKNRYVDAIVTPNHRWCLTGLYGRSNKKEWRVLSTTDVIKTKNCGHKIPEAAALKSEKEHAHITDNEIRLLVAMQADSWFNYRKTGGQPIVQFMFTKERKADRLRRLIKSMKIEGCREAKYDGCDKDRIYFYFKKDGLPNAVFEYLENKKFSRRIIEEFTVEQMNVLLDELRYWDGRYDLDGRTRSEVCFKDRTQAELVGEMALLTGRPYSVQPIINKDCWLLSFSKDDALLTCRGTKGIKTKDLGIADVCCISVPSGFIMVRRNKKHFISGNCQNIPKKNDELSARGCFIAPKGRVLRSIDFAAQELRVAFDIAGEKELINMIMHGKTALERDVHQRNADFIGSSRDVAKHVTFANLYGSGAATIANGAGITVAEAKRVKYGLNKAMPLVTKLNYRLKQWAEDDGYILTAYGNPLFQTDMRFTYKSLNQLIQGTCAIMIKKGLVAWDRQSNKYNTGWVRIIIHDEIVADFAPDETEEFIYTEFCCCFRGAYNPRNGMFMDATPSEPMARWRKC